MSSLISVVALVLSARLAFCEETYLDLGSTFSIIYGKQITETSPGNTNSFQGMAMDVTPPGHPSALLLPTPPPYLCLDLITECCS